MTLAVLYKLLAIIATVALGWAAGRRLGARVEAAGQRIDLSRLLGDLAFAIFVPALLFRTTARVDFATLPWATLAAFFVPVVVVVLLVYLLQRRRGAAARHGPAAPAVRAISAGFGNSVQVGLPVAAALFGEAGLAIHIAIVSLHSLVLLSLPTVLAELDVARAPREGVPPEPLVRTLVTTARNTLAHPVVLPVLLGLGWNLTGLGLHPVFDEALAILGSAVVPVCLVLIGLSLAQHGVRGRVGDALRLSAIKLLLLPAVVLPVAHWGFGLEGLALSVVVMAAALPIGSNALLFAQRYRTLEAEVGAASVASTVAFAGSAGLWLGALALLEP